MIALRLLAGLTLDHTLYLTLQPWAWCGTRRVIFLRIGGKKFVDANTKREMTSQLASQFDPLGVVSPLLLGGKLILQKVAASKIDWDETLPDNFRKDWKK